MNRASEQARFREPRPWRRWPGTAWRKDVRAWARLVLGLLLLADLLTALIVFKPWGGSEGDLGRQLAALSQEAARRREAVNRLRAVVAKVETARREAEEFVNEYFLDRRTVSSTLLGELDRLAKQAGVKQKEGSYLFEPIEGSQGLSMMTIHATYEGTYADLMQMLNLIDRSPHLLIINDLQAAPQASGQLLNVTMRINAFVREAGLGPGGAATKEVAARR